MLRLRPKAQPNWNTGQAFFIKDLTSPYDPAINLGGYGLPNTDILTINATRFVFSSYLKELAASTSTVIVAGTEYFVQGTGSFVFDTKIVPAGSVIIFETSGTPTLGTCTLTETGRFSPVVDFLPPEVQTGDFTPSLLGLNSLIFPDSIYSMVMEIFTTVYGPNIALIPAGVYIVIGSPGDTTTVSGQTYRLGEVFTKTGSFTMAGTARIVKQSDVTTDANGNPDSVNFLLGYYAFQALKNMQNRLVSGCCNCKSKLQTNLDKASNMWAYICNQLEVEDGNIDISAAQCSLDEIVNLDNDCNC